MLKLDSIQNSVFHTRNIMVAEAEAKSIRKTIVLRSDINLFEYFIERKKKLQ